MKYIIITYLMLISLFGYSQDRPIHFTYYELVKYKESKDTIFLNKHYKDEFEMMFFYVKVSKNKWKCVNNNGVIETGKFKRKFNFLTPWWNIFTNPVQMKKVNIWEYHLPDRIDSVDYGKNNGCCHSLYESNNNEK